MPEQGDGVDLKSTGCIAVRVRLSPWALSRSFIPNFPFLIGIISGREIWVYFDPFLSYLFEFIFFQFKKEVKLPLFYLKERICRNS